LLFCTLCNIFPFVQENNSDENSVKVFPNPASEIINISWRQHEGSLANITLNDISGRTLIQVTKKVDEQGIHSVSLPVNELAKGIYFIRVNEKVLKLMKL